MEAVGNGSFLYRWDIVEEEAGSDPAGDGDTPAAGRWKCREVTVWTSLTRERITEAVIATIWPADCEAKLINDYNAANLGMLGEEYIDRYRDFLAERKTIKERIAEDCEELNIL